jgi:hypothetical protein
VRSRERLTPWREDVAAIKQDTTEEGCSTPVKLITVVLPAPLGPINA